MVSGYHLLFLVTAVISRTREVQALASMPRVSLASDRHKNVKRSERNVPEDSMLQGCSGASPLHCEGCSKINPTPSVTNGESVSIQFTHHSALGHQRITNLFFFLLSLLFLSINQLVFLRTLMKTIVKKIEAIN